MRKPYTFVTIRTGDRIDLSFHRRGHAYALRGLDRFQQPAVWGWHAWQEWDGQALYIEPGVRYPAPTQANFAAADVDESTTFNPEMHGRDARANPQY